ncbi:MAG TPA: ABC transporter permease [Bryobacteraceae bacterium]
MLAAIGILWQASRYGVRQIRRNPGFAAVTVVILGVGIGACTAIFSLAEAALFPNFYANQPQRLVGLYTSGPSGTGFSSTSYPDYLYYRDQAHAFSGVMAYAHIRLRWTRGDRTTFPWAAVVTGNYFRVLGVRPLTGRGFSPDRNAAVAVVSYRFWERQLGSDQNVLVMPSLVLSRAGVYGDCFSGVGRIREL